MRATTVRGLSIVLLAALAAARSAADELPLVEVDAPESDRPMVLLLSGDGDWAAFVSAIAAAAAAAGSPVLGLESRRYLATRRTPEETAAALEPAVREHLARWRRATLVVVGYSRGADLAPFVLNRWPSDLRARVRALVLIGFSEHAGFEFHWDDLVRDVRRSTDLPTRPEMEKLVDVASWCIRGAEEKDSFCERPVAGMRVLEHPGGHRASRDDGTVALVLEAIDAAR